jgi:hypothetical protein
MRLGSGLVCLVIFAVVTSGPAGDADRALAMTSSPSTSQPSGPGCGGSAGASASDSGISGTASQNCGTAPGDGHGIGGAKPSVLYRQVDCGAPRVGVPAVTNHANFCNLVRRDCSVADPKDLPTDPHVSTLALLRSDDGAKTWIYDGADCTALTAAPRVTPLLVRQQIEKLVPRPGIGVAPPGGKTLVNLQTVLWANTPADRGLGTVTLLGTYRVALRVHVQRVAWAFGDGATETSDGPGLPYRKGEHCTTVTCAGHFGHVYASTGTMRITSRVTWSGQYSVNGGPWQDVAGTVDGPPASIQITVLEARGVLVADPTPS